MPGADTGKTIGNARISNHAPIDRAPRNSAMSASDTRSDVIDRTWFASKLRQTSHVALVRIRPDRARLHFCAATN
jgi:hypothetical protein